MSAAMLFFDVAGTTCAVDVAWVHGIAALEPFTPVPGAPMVVLGLMHAGGHVAPVLAGRRLLGLEDAGEASDEGMVVVLEVARAGERVRVGLAVDDVHGVATLAASHLESCAVVLDPLELFDTAEPIESGGARALRVA